MVSFRMQVSMDSDFPWRWQAFQTQTARHTHVLLVHHRRSFYSIIWLSIYIPKLKVSHRAKPLCCSLLCLQGFVYGITLNSHCRPAHEKVSLWLEVGKGIGSWIESHHQSAATQPLRTSWNSNPLMFSLSVQLIPAPHMSCCLYDKGLRCGYRPVWVNSPKSKFLVAVILRRGNL